MATHGLQAVDAGWADALARAGIHSVATLLDRAEWVRDLPERANLRLEIQGRLAHVKLAKRRDRSPEAVALAWARDHGLPTARLVFEGAEPGRGAVAGLEDLAPARPLDDLLREGALTGAVRLRVLDALALAVAHLHWLRRHHRDLYLNHVYVDPAADAPLVAIVDWERLGRHRSRLGRRAVKDLAALEASLPEGTVSRGERLRFLARYLHGLLGADVRPRFARLKRRIERKAARIRAHVPRTPVGEAARPSGGRP